MEVKRINFPVSFGIFKAKQVTKYGSHVIGEYKGYNIEIYNDTVENAKLFYVSDSCLKWVKAKLIYFSNGEKKEITKNRAHIDMYI